jgi:hypothetical protein
MELDRLHQEHVAAHSQKHAAHSHCLLRSTVLTKGCCRVVLQELDSRDKAGGAGGMAAPHHAPAVQMIQTG